MYVSLSTFWKHEYKQSILLSLEICIRKRDVLKNPVACQTCDKRRGYAHQNGRKIKSSPEKVTQTYKECWQTLCENVKKCKRRKVLVIIIPRHNKAPAVCWPIQFFIAHGANENLSDIIFRWIIERTSKRLL